MMSEGKSYDVGDLLPVSSFDAGTNVLVTGSAGSGKTYLGARILAEGADGNEGSLAVTTDGNADEILELYREKADDGSLHFVDCTGAGSGSPDGFPSDRFETVSSPGDMTGVGVAFEKYTKRVGERVEGSRVMYDSLTTLLRYVDQKRAYRFVDILTGRFRAEDCLSVFTLDGGTVDEKTSSMFTHEFDVEVSLRVEDGTREVSVSGDSDAPDGWTPLG